MARILETVKGSCAHGDDHDKDDTNDPAGKGLEKDEERNRTRTGFGKNTQDNNCGNSGSNSEILVCLGSKGSQPEGRKEEVVGQNGNRKDVQKLPAEQVGLGKARLVDQRSLDLGLGANGNGSDDDKTNDHSTLNNICNERDPKSSKGLQS
ncbi:hypothetical protein HG531_012958 [Fusarium graminearum]|nr:hypothetical protein HG531_012958 [Fusarium graminearum]